MHRAPAGGFQEDRLRLYGFHSKENEGSIDHSGSGRGSQAGCIE